MNAAKELWAKMLTDLETKTSAVNFDVWIKTLEPVAIIDVRLVLMASCESAKNFVNEKFRGEILRALKAVNPLLTDIVLTEPSEAGQYSEDAPDPDPRPEPPPKIEVTPINPKYNFENFVVGNSNRFMHAAARAVADEPGARHNPLFIYGGAGLGKTHIMHAIGNSVRVSNPSMRVLYVSSEKFVNEFIESIRTTKGKSSGFREKYRNADVLMIDDIQFIAGKSGTQEEMFHTFNELHDENKQLVLSSDRPPKEIPDLEERLRSRFEWGLIVDVQPPDLETRIAILQKKAQIERYNISGETLAFMAEHMSNNIRDMEGLLNKVIFLSRLYETEPKIETVREALKDYADRTEEAVSADAVIECTCKYFGVSKDELVGKKKSREIVEPRQICIYIITELLALPLAAIGNIFGGRDHTTVMHARDKVAQALNTSNKTRTSVQDIKNMLLKK
ncbi:MAG: chromosomal replication initiator protein DnaA [Clostridiales bacterium]|jgi:chromosomal replication initiator protein|nr:chromosomal replication initiator protein DnaA [Clostridiales bacterium]